MVRYGAVGTGICPAFPVAWKGGRGVFTRGVGIRCTRYLRGLRRLRAMGMGVACVVTGSADGAGRDGMGGGVVWVVVVMGEGFVYDIFISWGIIPLKMGYLFPGVF